MEASLENKYRQLQQVLQDLGSVILAFSGGADSSLLLFACQEALPGRFLAVTVQSPLTPARELAAAQELARQLGARHLLLASTELENPEFTANPPDKCYLCKKGRFLALAALAHQERLACLLDGSNLDDLNDYRPGRRALQELGVRSPLSEVGLGKAEIRRLSRQLGLSTWNKPADACLASRIPYGSPITPDKLHQVEAGEEFLKALGLNPQLRVRHHGDTARLEVAAADLPRLLGEDVRRRVVDFFRDLGFNFVTLDLEGYRTGSLNQALS